MDSNSKKPAGVKTSTASQPEAGKVKEDVQPKGQAPSPTMGRIRQQPTHEQLMEKRDKAKQGKKDYVKARTASGGEMWDPRAQSWVSGKLTLALDTSWLRRQAEVKKIIIES